MKLYVGTYVIPVMAKTDYIANLGPLALVSRLRRLLNRMVADGERVYREMDFTFKVKWFPVLHLLNKRSPMALTRIAETLDMAHPSIIEVSDDMIREGLLVSRKSTSDRRRRELALTANGRRLCVRLRPVWKAFKQAGDEVNTELGNNFLESLKKLETSMEAQSMYDRICSRLDRVNKEKTISTKPIQQRGGTK